MPELPEVETVVRSLEPALKGLKFLEVHTNWKNHVVWGEGPFDELEGSKVLEVKRRGKFIVIFLENNYVIVVHLRMSGRILIREVNEEALKFERTKLEFEGVSVRFCDVRKFGKVWVSTIDEYEKLSGISRLGIEPFGDDMSAEIFKNIFAGRSGVVKKSLLDQSLITGIGNIYADEACFYAGIRPNADLKSLSKKELDVLFDSVMKALNQGIENRGTSISDFQDAYGKNGSNQEKLFVYGRGGEPCFKCGTTLVKCKVASRGTVYCEKCQRA
ncbi:DNA-formamidopyrimidine glycosylase [Candidatus Peregrinibacteria bacterium CG10_big_fil_rev_8_21_14_0_10_36_19]|nr:MAG: DNA-formamidopyrimidine glycosylase [Candidatus Peregrinibacteria bacterium CG10_big_fil_rev_8_21_14_0_10_36_19]